MILSFLFKKQKDTLFVGGIKKFAGVKKINFVFYWLTAREQL